MRLAFFVVTTAAILTTSSVLVEAHHSYSEFREQTVSVEGSITSIEFASPHTTITLRTADGAIYKATWNAAFQLVSMGVRNTDLKAGDIVAVTGFPHRDSSVRELAKLREVRRLRDGWTWKMENGRVTIVAAH